MSLEVSKVWDSFKARADKAAFWESWIGSVLARSGLYTLHHPFVVDGGEYHAQSWDLDVSKEAPCADGYGSMKPMIQVECKSLSVGFTRAKDYPFDSLLVCSQYSWLRKWPGKSLTQRDFLFVSTQTGSVVWLPVGSLVQMNHEVTDSTRGQVYKAVITDRSNLRELSDFVDEVTGDNGGQ